MAREAPAPTVINTGVRDRMTSLGHPSEYR